MADVTKRNEQLNTTALNPALLSGANSAGGNATALNPAVVSGASGATVLNPQLIPADTIEPGTVLCEHYCVLEKMPVLAGEADLYICIRGGENWVAKVYRRPESVKEAVTEKLLQLDSPYVAAICALGEYRGMTVEILPYYSLGSLQNKVFSYDQLRSNVIPCLNKGLKVLHDAGIIHKDLKPSNIMLTNEAGDVTILDFGISSVVEADNTVIVTQTGMTPEYAAPETFRGLYSSNADYYSLGITLYALYCGKTPYGDMPAEEIEKYIAIQRIPFPDHMPAPLQELIKALTYYDISNRRDKSNPNRRWGYEEVEAWLAGAVQTVPGEGVDRRTIKPFSFAGGSYENRVELVRALVTNWNEGKKALFRGKLSEYYKLYDPRAFEICQDAEREATRISGKDDFIFWKTMYALDPQNKDFFWKGRVYAGLPALGRELLEHLRRNDPALNDFMDSVFKEELLSEYVLRRGAQDPTLQEAVAALETAGLAYSRNSREKRVNLYLTGYMLSGQKVLYVAGEEFHTLDELTSYMKALLGENNENLEAFKAFCHKLMDQYENLIPALESWLIALGKRDALNRWHIAMGNRE